MEDRAARGCSGARAESRGWADVWKKAFFAIEYKGWHKDLAEHAVALARRDAAAKQPVRPGEVGIARYPRLVPRDKQCAEVLAKRTLTNLYNQRPTWLDLAHRHLDEAVCAAYRAARGGDWSADLPAERILERLLALNLADAADA
jgi:hypothetical protein